MGIGKQGIAQVTPHEDTHPAGGTDALASAVALAAMADLANTKVWQGDGTNRPSEVAMPAGYTPPTRGFSLQPVWLDGMNWERKGNFVVAKLGPTADYHVGWSFDVPADFGSLVSVKVHFIEEDRDDGDFEWDAETGFSAVGEAYTTHTDSTTGSLTCVDNRNASADITAAFTGLAAGDHVGVIFGRTSIAASDYGQVKCLEFRYTE